MEEWKEYKIKDVTSVLGDGIHGTPKYDDAGSVFFINGNNLENGKIVIKENTKRVSLEEAMKHTKPLTERTLFVSINGTLGNVARYNGESCILGKSACYFNVKEEFDLDYIYYVVANVDFRKEIERLATGSTIKNVSLATMRNYTFHAPSLQAQKQIAAVLKSLDDKIECNRRINENLEQQAQALFKSWFVDFEPFKDHPFVESDLGMIPKGWKTVKLGQICICCLGGTPSRNNIEYWGGNISWINSGEVNKFRIIEPSEFITEDGLKHSATKLLPKKTTVLAITGATLGQVSLLEVDSCANQSVIGVLENDCIPYEFIYPLINYRIKELMSHMTGGAQQHINKNNVEDLDVIIPDMAVMSKYKTMVQSIYSKIGDLCFENKYLAELRDTLLPRLMSGEITLNDIG